MSNTTCYKQHIIVTRKITIPRPITGEVYPRTEVEGGFSARGEGVRGVCGLVGDFFLRYCCVMLPTIFKVQTLKLFSVSDDYQCQRY